MTEKLQQIIKDEVVKLPKDTQDAINSLNWTNVAEEIGKKFLLDEREVNDLQSITLTVLLGLTDLDLYATVIEDKIGTTKDDAKKIADEAIQKIFTPINNVFTENIKNNLKDKNPSPEQTLNFILSGGDYSAFVEPIRENSPLPERPITPPTLKDIKANINT